MAGLKPELFDYNAAVDKADAEGYDWIGLETALQDPGFQSLSPEHQKHLVNLYTVKAQREEGNRVDPNAQTGELGGLKQLGALLKAVLMPSVGGPGLGGAPGTGPATLPSAVNVQEQAIESYVEQGRVRQDAEDLARADINRAGNQVVRQLAHYLTGGAVEAPKESKDPYVREAMGTVKTMTQFGAIGTHLLTGSWLLGFVSKAPLISAATANMSRAAQGLIKGAILDFGSRAAVPEGLPKEEQLGISDDVARWLAPESVEQDPSGLAGRVISGLGGAAEGALLGYFLYGISHGAKLADAKHGYLIRPKLLEQMREQLAAAGVDVTSMTKQDAWLTYRTRMPDHVQSVDEAAFNGERMSAEAWIAQSYIADPGITELTSPEGRILWGTFSQNKGGISVIKGIDNPEQALEKLRKVGINVDATIIPRRDPSSSGPGGRPRPAKNPPKAPDDAIIAPSPEGATAPVRVTPPGAIPAGHLAMPGTGTPIPPRPESAWDFLAKAELQPAPTPASKVVPPTETEAGRMLERAKGRAREAAEVAQPKTLTLYRGVRSHGEKVLEPRGTSLFFAEDPQHAVRFADVRPTGGATVAEVEVKVSNPLDLTERELPEGFLEDLAGRVAAGDETETAESVLGQIIENFGRGKEGLIEWMTFNHGAGAGGAERAIAKTAEKFGFDSIRFFDFPPLETDPLSAIAMPNRPSWMVFDPKKVRKLRTYRKGK